MISICQCSQVQENTFGGGFKPKLDILGSLLEFHLLSLLSKPHFPGFPTFFPGKREMENREISREFPGREIPGTNSILIVWITAPTNHQKALNIWAIFST